MPQQIAIRGFFNLGVIAERAKVHPGAAVTIGFIDAVETLAGSVAVAVS